MTAQGPPPRTVAAFDFDGTITRRDTMVPFLIHALGWRLASAAIPRLSVDLARLSVSKRSRDATKVVLFRRLLGGRSLASLEEAAESFADRLVEVGLRDDTLERIRVHGDAGHELVVVSASAELWVAPIARRLGFATTLATRLEVDPDGCITGRLVGSSCRGPEKVRRLQEWLVEETPVVIAYGDSSGDREMLEFAGEGGIRLRRERLRRRR